MKLKYLLLTSVILITGCSYSTRLSSLEANQAKIVNAVNTLGTQHNALVAELQKEFPDKIKPAAKK